MLLLLLSLSIDVAVDILAVPPVPAAAAAAVVVVVLGLDVVVVVDDVVVGVVVAVVIVVIVAAWGTDTCTSSFCSCVGARACWVLGREVSGPLFRVQALNALIDFTVFLVYRINLLIDLGFVGGSFGQLSSPPRTLHLRPNYP